MDELKPCPFCGLIPNTNVHNYSFGIRHKIICKCGIQTKEYKKLPMAKRAWNRRADNTNEIHSELIKLKKSYDNILKQIEFYKHHM